MAEVSSSNAMPTGNVKVHLDFYSPECLLGAEEGGLDSKLNEK